MADTCSFILELQKGKHSSTGSTLLNDDEIFKTLETFGLIRGSDKTLDKDITQMNLKEAVKIQAQQV